MPHTLQDMQCGHCSRINCNDDISCSSVQKVVLRTSRDVCCAFQISHVSYSGMLSRHFSFKHVVKITGTNWVIKVSQSQSYTSKILQRISLHTFKLLLSTDFLKTLWPAPCRLDSPQTPGWLVHLHTRRMWLGWSMPPSFTSTPTTLRL